MSEDDLADRLRSIGSRIEAAAGRAGLCRAVTLVAVSKTVPAERVLQAYEAGQRAFGENRVQEAAGKIEALRSAAPDARWHLIGHLQTNKARQAASLFSLIESVDSLRLARKLDAEAAERSHRLPVLLEVNVAGESSKSGFGLADLRREMADLIALRQIELRGLMTVAPLVSDPEQVRPVFRCLRETRDSLREEFGLETLCDLSMGMSNDFEVAVEEGATMVRIGRALFGERAPVRTGIL